MTNFELKNFKIDELNLPFGNSVVRDNVVMDVPKCEIYKHSVKRNFTVPCIMDEFSYKCFSYEFNLIPLTGSTWKQTFTKNKVDFVLFESAWHGNGGEWSNCLTNYGLNSKKQRELDEIMKYIDSNGIKKVFYNKEDSIGFDKFLNFAKLFNKPNNLIITTDSTVLEKYKKAGCKNVVAFPFCCQPVLHNPTNRDNNYKNIFFPSTYYREIFPERCKIMDEMIDKYIDYIDIYDRQFVYNKMTSQVDKYSQHCNTYKFPDKYSKLIQGYLCYEQVLYLMKQYKAVMNVNTITISPTMFSRRVIECAASGTPIISNDSIGMKSIFGDKVVDFNSENEVIRMLKNSSVRNNYGNKLYKIVLNNYTYAHIVNIITNRLKLKKKYSTNFVVLLFLENRDNIKKFKFVIDNYNYYIISNTYTNKNLNIINFNNIKNISKYDYYILLNENCYYSSIYVKNMLLPTLFTDALVIGKGTFYHRTKNIVVKSAKEHSFDNKINSNTYVINDEIRRYIQFDSNIVNNITGYIRNNFNGKNVYATDRDDFIDLDDKFHYYLDNQIEIEQLVDFNEPTQSTLKVIMCCWDRIENIGKTVACLDIQIDRDFELYIWNNNIEIKNELEEQIKEIDPQYNVYIYHANENIRGIGRFYMVTHLLENDNFDYVIFIDDDQIFDNKLIYNFRRSMVKKTAYCWYGRIFAKNSSYTDGTYRELENGSKINYGGTGGMIIDTSIFRDSKLYSLLPKEFMYVEDLWLSFYAQKYHNYKYYKIEQNISVIRDNKDQCKDLWKEKNMLLEFCRHLGWRI